MTRTKRPISGVIVAILAWGGAGVVVWGLSPTWWSELLAMSLLSLALILTISWIVGKRKLGVLLALALVGLLLMQRFRVLDGITFGVWLVGLGLITFVN